MAKTSRNRGLFHSPEMNNRVPQENAERNWNIQHTRFQWRIKTTGCESGREGDCEMFQGVTPRSMRRENLIWRDDSPKYMNPIGTVQSVNEIWLQNLHPGFKLQMKIQHRKMHPEFKQAHYNVFMISLTLRRIQPQIDVFLRKVWWNILWKDIIGHNVVGSWEVRRPKKKSEIV